MGIYDTHVVIIHLVSHRKILTVLRTATDFLTEALVNVAAPLVRAIAAVLSVIADLVLRNAPPILAHEKGAVTWLLWKTKPRTHRGVASECVAMNSLCAGEMEDLCTS